MELQFSCSSYGVSHDCVYNRTDYYIHAIYITILESQILISASDFKIVPCARDTRAAQFPRRHTPLSSRRVYAAPDTAHSRVQSIQHTRTDLLCRTHIQDD